MLNVHIAYAILMKNLLHSIPAVKRYKNPHLNEDYIIAVHI